MEVSKQEWSRSLDELAEIEIYQEEKGLEDDYEVNSYKSVLLDKIKTFEFNHGMVCTECSSVYSECDCPEEDIIPEGLAPDGAYYGGPHVIYK